jgi:DNA-binding NarL/FixJ family response regulator
MPAPGSRLAPAVPECANGSPARLTARESAVLCMLADGLIVTAIARRLGIAPATVGKHVEHIYSKLGAHHRLEAVLIAQRLGLLPNGG